MLKKIAFYNKQLEIMQVFNKKIRRDKDYMIKKITFLLSCRQCLLWSTDGPYILTRPTAMVPPKYSRGQKLNKNAGWVVRKLKESLSGAWIEDKKNKILKLLSTLRKKKRALERERGGWVKSFNNFITFVEKNIKTRSKKKNPHKTDELSQPRVAGKKSHF